MMNCLVPVLALIAFVPSLAHAQAFKCTQDNGSISFQAQPCQSGTTGSQIDLTPANGSTSPARAPRKAISPPSSSEATAGSKQYPSARGDDIERMKAENAELQAAIAKIKAENPDWHHSQTLSRSIAQADALNAQIQAGDKH